MRLLYCVGDAATERWIQKLNKNSESLYVLYGDDKKRIDTYRDMIARTLECVRAGHKVCMVFYGHPGMFVYPSHEAIRQARTEGYRAEMLPAVSSLDCLFADLGIDPASGCQMMEATDLLIRRRQVDTSFNLIVWQAGAVGDLGFKFKGFDGRNVPVLQEVLASIYGDDYECTVYEASQYSVCEPLVKKIRIRDIASAGLTGISTLHLAPKLKAQLDMPMLERLGLDRIVKQRLAKSPTAVLTGAAVS